MATAGADGHVKFWKVDPESSDPARCAHTHARTHAHTTVLTGCAVARAVCVWQQLSGLVDDIAGVVNMATNAVVRTTPLGTEIRTFQGCPGSFS